MISKAVIYARVSSAGDRQDTERQVKKAMGLTTKIDTHGGKKDVSWERLVEPEEEK